MVERSAEELSRIATSLPGFRLMVGILWAVQRDESGASRWRRWMNPDDPATGGCLLHLLTSEATSPSVLMGVDGVNVTVWEDVAGEEFPIEAATGDASSLGRACIAAAEALGRWPGGSNG